MFGRFDLPIMHSACGTLRNCFVSYRGGGLSRAGTSFVGFSKQTGRSYPPRLIDFQFSINEGLALEFGNFYMRVISDGGFVTESPIFISNITQANPGVITLAAFSITGATAVNGSVSASYAADDTVTIAGGTSTVPAELTVTTTGLASLSLNSSGIASVAPGYRGYTPGDTITLAGGAFLTPAVLTVTNTQVNGAVIFAAGSGGTPGTQTVTGTTGTGTKFQASVTVNGAGHISAINSISRPGNYTVNPTFNASPFDQYVELVTGGGLSGAELTLSMGVLDFSILNPGSFTQNAIGGTFTQNSTSGGGSGATFNTALFGPNVLTVLNGGIYSVVPTNPAAQASTSGSGVGATFNLSSSAAASLSTGDWVYLQNIGGMTELNGDTVVLTQLTSTTYSIRDVYGNNINTSGFPAYTSGGTASRIYTVTTPYSEQDLEWLKIVQSADVMSICCVNQQTLTEYQPQDLSRSTDTDFTFTPAIPDETVLPPSTLSGTASTTGTVDYQYVATAVNPNDGTESIASPIAIITDAVDIASTAGTITLTLGTSPTPGVNEYNIYKATPAYDSATVPVGSLFGYAGSCYGVQFLDTNIVADFTQVPPTHQNPFARGALDSVVVITSGSGYPSASYVINTSTGSGAILIPIIIGGEVVQWIVQESGENYQLTDTITISGQVGGTGAAASYTVDGSGGVATVTLSAGGTNYIDPTVSATGGTGAVFVPIVEGGVITKIYWTNSGTGNPGGVLTITDAAPGGGTGATATLNVGPETGTYPGVPFYFQERRGFAFSLNDPDTYWMSQPGSFINFDFRVPTIDSDSITGSPWSTQVNGIQWAIQVSAGLLVMTGLQAWLLVGTGSFATNVTPIAPSSQVANPQPSSGCSPTLPPIRINYDVIYVTAQGGLYYDLPYQLYALSEPIDLTQFSSHLFVGFMPVEHAWCEQPNKILWSVRDDGVLLSLTWLKAQEVAGWGRHDTQGLWKSVCSVVEPPVNALYLAAQRFPGTNTCYTIERMDNRIWADVEDTWCVDCGLTLPQPEPAATLTASSAYGLGSCTGVTNLVGGTGWSAGTTASVVDAPMTPNQALGPGSGAVPALTIAGGVITAISFPGGNQGINYRNPQLVFNDPANTGSGTSATITLNNTMTFAASAAVFSNGNVGNVIRAGGGIAVITAYTDTEHVTANMLSPIIDVFNDGSSVLPQPQTAGNWTMTAPVNSIGGLGYLAGATVTGLADGNVIPPTVVPLTGIIALPAPTNPNVTGATAVTVGLGFQAQLQSVYLDAGEPTVQGQRKKIAEVVLRVENSRGLKVGVSQPDGSTQSPIQVAPPWYGGPGGITTVPDIGPNFPRKPYNALCTPLLTGDISVPSNGGFDMRGQIAVQQDNPLPMEITALIPSLMPGDTPQLQAPKKQGKG